MEGVELVVENFIKIQEVKEEPIDDAEEDIWNCALQEESQSYSLKSEVTEEGEEEDLKPPVRVFLDAADIPNEEVQQEHPDHLARCSENVVIKSEWSIGGANIPAENNHTVQARFQCSFCKKSFSQKKPLCRHMRIHTSEKHFQCSFCEMSFRHSAHLCIHMRTHTGEKPFQCTICEKRFTQKGQLGVHMRTHTGEKPFQCSICEKRFSEKKSVCLHMRTHTGEKPFQCSICEKHFSLKQTLRMHMGTHLARNLSSVTTVRKDLVEIRVAHMRTHTGEKQIQ